MRGIRCWSKSKSTNRIRWAIKKNANTNPESKFILTILFKKRAKKEIKIFSSKCNCVIKDGKLSRSES